MMQFQGRLEGGGSGELDESDPPGLGRAGWFGREEADGGGMAGFASEIGG